MSKHTTLVQAHRIRSMAERGVKQVDIAEQIGCSERTVRNILSGKGLLQQRQLADRMEVFMGGAIIGSGNLRFHAANPSADNDDGHAAGKAQHPFDTAHENGDPVPTHTDVLSLLLAEEDIIERLEAAGIDPESVLILDPDSDTEEDTKFGSAGNPARDAAVHDETWEEFKERAKADGIGDKPGAIMKRLENEGQDIDAWTVRDTSFSGWGSPWVHPNDRNQYNSEGC